jgi:hypothetical protein
LTREFGCDGGGCCGDSCCSGGFGGADDRSRGRVGQGRVSSVQRAQLARERHPQRDFFAAKFVVAACHLVGTRVGENCRVGTLFFICMCVCVCVYRICSKTTCAVSTSSASDGAPLLVFDRTTCAVHARISQPPRCRATDGECVRAWVVVVGGGGGGGGGGGRVWSAGLCRMLPTVSMSAATLSAHNSMREC